MKIIKRISMWILLALVFEIGCFGYLDKFYFVEDTTFKTVKVEVPVVQTEKKDDESKIKISDDINSKYKTSYNGKYMIYKEGNDLKLLETATGDLTTISPGPNESISYYIWAPETELITIVKRNNDQKKFKLYRYNAKLKDKMEEIRCYMDGSPEGQEVAISVKDSKAEIVDIDISRFSFVTYIKVINNGKNSEIYRMDRMSQMEKVANSELKTKMIGKIYSTKHSERLIYEDTAYNRVYATGIKNALGPKDAITTVLLGVDSNDDTLYIGTIVENKINKIYFGMVEDPIEKWKSIEIKEPVYRSQIFIGSGGNVYVNNNLQGIVTEIRTGNETTYRGRMLEMFDGGIMTESQSMLYRQAYAKKIIQ